MLSLIIGCAVVGFALMFWGSFEFVKIYNMLVALRNRAQNALSQIDVQLKRRYDLIPNIVAVCSGYMKHEQATLRACTEARNLAQQAAQNVNIKSPETVLALGAAEAGLTGAMTRLLGVVEAYPDLKANQNMLKLQEELSSTENKVAFARQAFNDQVMRYNEYIQSFPQNYLANSMGFAEMAYFNVDPAEKTAVSAAPKVVL